MEDRIVLTRRRFALFAGAGCVVGVVVALWGRAFRRAARSEIVSGFGGPSLKVVVVVVVVSWVVVVVVPRVIAFVILRSTTPFSSAWSI